MFLRLLKPAAFCMALAFAPFVAQAEAFLPGLEDIPLMEGLASEEGDVMVFDTPEGRIAEALASGMADRDQVLEFYRTTLPQLGWIPDGEGGFTREQETLELEISPVGASPVVLKIRIKPQNEARK